MSATRVKALNAPGRYSDGGGLHLYISKAVRKSWVMRITVDGRWRDIDLGGYPSVSLARARDKAADNRAAVAEGRDPVAEKHAPSMPTFREAAYAVHEANKPRWRNPRHMAGWIQTLERHAMPNVEQHTPGPDRPRGRAAGPHPDMDDSSGDGPSGPSTYEDRLQMGNIIRVHGVQSGGRSHRWCLAPMPKVKAHFRALPYTGSRGGTRDGCSIPCFDVRQVLLPIPGSHGSPLR